MARSAPALDPTLDVRELTPARWKDFEAFFARYHAVAGDCGCMCYRRERSVGYPARREELRTAHRTLVERGAAHGARVYREGVPVGGCPFGRREELPRIDRGRRCASVARSLPAPAGGRITCFFVDRRARRGGVARPALQGALEAIRRPGGGLVEGYPVARGGSGASRFGTVSMFGRKGFRRAGRLGPNQLFMRRSLRPRRAVRARP